ncbi:MAG: hypothetical protein FWH53_00550 [Leptospirales bacterium]|nr:hypothetical protein [Leptospirales bacterium]
MSSVFSRVGGLTPPLSAFDLSYEVKTTCDMGQLIPIMFDDVAPGDHFSISTSQFIRMQPMVAPVLHEINVYNHFFFVPYRLLWDQFEDYITGGKDGLFTAEIPVWDPSPGKYGIKSLWNYFALPPNVKPEGALPVDFLRRAYNLIYNEYYIDRNLQQIDIPLDNEDVLIRSWDKDYFTSALPWQQRGSAPAMPVSGLAKAAFDGPLSGILGVGRYKDGSQDDVNHRLYLPSPYPGMVIQDPVVSAAAGNIGIVPDQPLVDWLNDNHIDFSTMSSFDITDLRLAFQIQKYLERNARIGSRYTEQLKGRYGVSPTDERLDRPEYIGGTRQPVIVSEVLQTSEDGATPQGNMAGHGISIGNQFAGKYKVEEFGIIIGIMSIMPRPAYQDGVNRQWLKYNKFEFITPEFVNMSEQEIYNAELCATSDPVHNKDIFGFQGRYDQYRYRPNVVTGDMVYYFRYWHLGRYFDPLNPPVLNQDFVLCKPEETKRIFAVPSEDGFLVSHANHIMAYRPLPVMAEPGLMDHH